LAEAARVAVRIDERALPLTDAVRGACELLGLDPLYVANEGKVIAVVSSESVDVALACFRMHPLGRHAVRIGEIVSDAAGEVLVRGTLGQLRILDEPSGAPLPRIC
jgi:hydrogenase expression/formation protein HypE